jgi:hypothetical protein
MIWKWAWPDINPLNAELNPICHPLTLLGAHHIFYVCGLGVNVVSTFAYSKRRNLVYNNQCSDRHSNQEPAKCNYRALYR